MSTSATTFDQVKPQAEAAEARLKQQQYAIRKLYEDQQKQQSDGDYWFSGTLNVTSLILYTSVKLADMNFTNSSTVLEFNGTSFGIGLGGVSSFGGGYTYKDPDWLNGKTCGFELLWLGTGAAGLQMVIWYEGTIVAAFDAIGAGVGGGLVPNGEGTFKKVS